MGSSKLVLLVAAAILLGVANCATRQVGISKGVSSQMEHTTSVSEKIDSDEKPFLRSLKETKSGANEERAVNFSFLKNLKKNVPGAEALKKAAAARSVATQAKKAKNMKQADLFKLSGMRDHEIFPKFQEWRQMEKTSGEAVNGVFQAMKSSGMTKQEAIAIGNQYARWLSVF
ncbi:secreted RxLR effector peptide protein, putative [Phytophthora infestans T30-4]|uniref:RxLR effector protein n=2 Tax=Phytophthora infestans TaxID=4787 RepID=A0A833TD48_PHYIN